MASRKPREGSAVLPPMNNPRSLCVAYPDEPVGPDVSICCEKRRRFEGQPPANTTHTVHDPQAITSTFEGCDTVGTDEDCTPEQQDEVRIKNTTNTGLGKKVVERTGRPLTVGFSDCD